MTAVLSLWRGVIHVRPSMAQMCADVAEAHGVTVDAIRGPDRSAWISVPRQHFMALAKPHYSLMQIARFLHRKDHTTIIHGARRHLEREGAAG